MFVETFSLLSRPRLRVYCQSPRRPVQPGLSSVAPARTLNGVLRRLVASLAASPEEKEPGENGPRNSGDSSGEMAVISRKKWPRDNRDKLPFDVYVTTPPPYYLGQFKLDPRVHNGDILEFQNHAYVIKRTRLHYYYRNGEFRVGRKSVDVNTVARSHINSFLDRIYSRSNVHRSP
ncbi:hypothetical protein CYME_CMD094C [Cyanidioschyzon merolae strain 10D]|uniref:Uncharacterized protein n=1 Tax=Cyanidioschyzon merolae (strain NIES-3377 / 10D) TaxID=280699 RepID=M1VF65_CYAM1|nr:hypothetical protein CYME_CMD094C [Cyanidioschyzon merolae strain 10D]BAM79168.1 hypothetical protein CYME_CMD094C [Cyanidioschyzon merolae strain 10D]|eukprot:XP_005535454.1 hypothetical protein CYME_CMD094C [Cyanidioschyzon merolae strain 10D]